MEYVGIDPGQRHTGLCFLTEAGPEFHEIKPENEDILSCLTKVRADLTKWLYDKGSNPTLIAIERQLSVGGQSSSLLFAVQMTILDVVTRFSGMPATLVMPLPIQLQSYIKKRHGGDISSARATVEHFRQQLKWERRISQHCVDAYYLARLAKDVHEGTWEYKLPSKEAKLFPGVILNVKRR